MKATQCTVDGCDHTGKIMRGMCGMHYQRWCKYGTTEASPYRFPSRGHWAPAAERLAAKLVTMPNGCIEWTGNRCWGYGQIMRDGKLTKTHRFAWELVNGPIPDGLCVLHRCDNRPCCNVEHLFLGTYADNAQDREAKGRGRHAAQANIQRYSKGKPT